ncbi:MAG: Blue-light-activated protein [Gemmatimonadetes bacterium]|nr:Blue-light-activated protein [Gemmatimonadota bacterium]
MTSSDLPSSTVTTAVLAPPHEAALRAEASLLQDALDTLPDRVAMLSSEGDVLAVNRAWTEFADANERRDGDTGVGTNYLLVCERQADAGAVEARAAGAGARDVLAGRRESFGMEYPSRTPDSERWFRLAVRGAARPGAVAAVVTHADVTEDRLAVRTATALAEQSLEFVSILEADGLFRYVSLSVERMLGYAPAQLVGTFPMALVHDEDRGAMREAYYRLVEGGPGATVEMRVRLRHENGSWRDIEGSGRNLLHDGSVRGMTTTARDVTARRDAERSTQALQARFRGLVETAREVIWTLDDDGVTTYVNPRVRTMLGYAVLEIVGKPIFDYLSSESVDTVRSAMTTGAPGGLLHVEFIRRNATIVPTLVATSAIIGEPRTSDGTLLMVTDLSARNAAERRMAGALRTSEQAVRALRRTEQRLSEQFTKLPTPMFLWEARGDDFVLVDVNEAAAPLSALHWEGAVGRTATDIFPSGWPVRDDAIGCLQDGLIRRRSIVFDMPHGTQRTFDLTTGPQHPDRVLVHAVDITEQTQLATELRQAQKMEAVGQLAGGVAHDFNNLLTVITGHCEFLLEGQTDAGVADTDARRVDARAIQEAAQRAAALTRQLLAFSHKQLLQPMVLDLNVVVEQTHRLLERLLGDDIAVEMSMDPSAGQIMADAGQIEQVLMNLILNARDAMPFGGRVSVATTNVAVERGAARAHESLPVGSYVRLSISDTGAGMDKDTKARIFEPFFTTKEIGRGTGLGLSTVYGIVTRAGGYVVVESEPGLGATFDVYLPRVQDAAPRDPVARDTARTPRSSETILLVEDDTAVRKIVRRMLIIEGYQVLEAVDGIVALGLLESHEGRIDAVITDAVMPGMTGRTVLERARALRPACKTLLMSGYTGEEMTRRGISSVNVSFIQKPFTPTDFARQVRLALDT